MPVRVVELPQIADLVPAQAIRRRDHVTAFTFSKLLLPTALPELDQVLYLDVDILVRDSIEELLDWELTHPLGAVHEIGDGAAHLFGSTRVSYFNAGVLRMSLARMREMDVLGSAVEILRERPRLPFHDQDVLNLIFRHRHDSLPFAFNVFEQVASAKLPAWAVMTDPAIVHFVGPDKPWHDAYSSTFTREWRSAQAQAVAASPGHANWKAQPDPSATRLSVSAIVTRARSTSVGRRLRSALPDPLKHRVRVALLRLLPSGSPIHRDLRRGLLADVAALDPQEAPPAAEA
jgi:lipopolysaccharide biosynthesis glycosyltransferase